MIYKSIIDPCSERTIDTVKKSLRGQRGDFVVSLESLNSHPCLKSQYLTDLKTLINKAGLCYPEYANSCTKHLTFGAITTSCSDVLVKSYGLTSWARRTRVVYDVLADWSNIKKAVKEIGKEKKKLQEKYCDFTSNFSELKTKDTKAKAAKKAVKNQFDGSRERLGISSAVGYYRYIADIDPCTKVAPTKKRKSIRKSDDKVVITRDFIQRGYNVWSNPLKNIQQVDVDFKKEEVTVAGW